MCAGTPFWKLVLKQFDDLLVKVRQHAGLASIHVCMWTRLTGALSRVLCQILIVAAVVDFLIALSSGEEGLRCGAAFAHARWFS